MLTLSLCPYKGIHFFFNKLLCYLFLCQKFVLLTFTLLNIHNYYQSKGADQTKRHEEVKTNDMGLRLLEWSIFVLEINGPKNDKVLPITPKNEKKRNSHPWELLLISVT